MRKISLLTGLLMAGLASSAQTTKPAGTKPVAAPVKTTSPAKTASPAPKAATAKTTAKGVAAAAKTTATAPLVFKSTLDSASYAFGFSMASQLKGSGVKNLNYNVLVKGLEDAFANNGPAFSEETAQQCISNFFTAITAQKQAEDKLKYAANIKEAEDFMAKNKTKPGVITTASGLQYEVLTEGKGEKPNALDQVTVNYKGTLLNGFEFDSSYKRNEPTSFRLAQVIAGWTEGIQLMAPGAKYRFYIPYDLAYGDRGAGADIPPYSTLIFEVELLKVGADEQ